MKKQILLYTFLLMLVFAGCSSLEDDAKTAAHYRKESIELVRTKHLDDAKGKYDESQSIIDKYKNTDQYQEFYNIYNAYLHDKTTDK